MLSIDKSEHPDEGLNGENNTHVNLEMLFIEDSDHPDEDLNKKNDTYMNPEAEACKKKKKQPCYMSDPMAFTKMLMGKLAAEMSNHATSIYQNLRDQNHMNELQIKLSDEFVDQTVESLSKVNQNLLKIIGTIRARQMKWAQRDKLVKELRLQMIFFSNGQSQTVKIDEEKQAIYAKASSWLDSQDDQRSEDPDEKFNTEIQKWIENLIVGSAGGPGMKDKEMRSILDCFDETPKDKVTFHPRTDPFSIFIGQLRNSLSEHDEKKQFSSGEESCHLLPLQTSPYQPPKWLLLELIDGLTDTTLYMRGDKLCILGFENKKKMIYELAKSADMRIIKSSIYFGCGSDYPSLADYEGNGRNKTSTTLVDQRMMKIVYNLNETANGVHILANYDHTQQMTDTERRKAMKKVKKVLIRKLVVLAEVSRFVNLFIAVDGDWENNIPFLTHTFIKFMRCWSPISAKVRNTERSHELSGDLSKELNLKFTYDAMRVLHLVLNSKHPAMNKMGQNARPDDGKGPEAPGPSGGNDQGKSIGPYEQSDGNGNKKANQTSAPSDGSLAPSGLSDNSHGSSVNRSTMGPFSLGLIMLKRYLELVRVNLLGSPFGPVNFSTHRRLIFDVQHNLLRDRTTLLEVQGLISGSPSYARPGPSEPSDKEVQRLISGSPNEASPGPSEPSVKRSRLRNRARLSNRKARSEPVAVQGLISGSPHEASLGPSEPSDKRSRLRNRERLAVQGLISGSPREASPGPSEPSDNSRTFIDQTSLLEMQRLTSSSPSDARPGPSKPSDNSNTIAPFSRGWLLVKRRVYPWKYQPGLQALPELIRTSSCDWIDEMVTRCRKLVIKSSPPCTSTYSGEPLFEILALHTNLCMINTIKLYGDRGGVYLYKYKDGDKERFMRKRDLWLSNNTGCENFEFVVGLVTVGPNCAMSTHAENWLIEVDVPLESSFLSETCSTGGVFAMTIDYDEKRMDKVTTNIIFARGGFIRVTYIVFSDAVQAGILFLIIGHPSLSNVHGELMLHVEGFPIVFTIFSSEPEDGVCFMPCEDSRKSSPFPLSTLPLTRNEISLPIGSLVHVKGTLMLGDDCKMVVDQSLRLEDGMTCIQWKVSEVFDASIRITASSAF